MKAVILTKYGSSPDVLSLRDIETPEPAPKQVRVRVVTTTVNDWDWALMRGQPLVYRLFMGFFKPRTTILGAEVAGRVEKVGPEVTRFKEGDAVYGDISEAGFGAYAETVCVNESALLSKPESMSFADAAALPHAAGLAMQGLFDTGALADNHRVLINGAGGGVGTLGVQIARRNSVEVTGVDDATKHKAMRSVGFDRLIDYRTEDFTATGERYDLILDCKTTRPVWHYARALRPGGTYATVGGDISRLLQVIFLGSLLSLFTGKRFRIVALKPNKDLQQLHPLHAAGQLKCTLDGPFPLEQVPQALQYFGKSKHSGKVIITVSAP